MAAHNLANRKSQLSISILIGLLDRTSGYAGVTHLHKEPHQNSWIYPRVKRKKNRKSKLLHDANDAMM